MAPVCISDLAGSHSAVMTLAEGFLPYFRTGRWDKMRNLVPNGEVTEQHLDELATNGNRIIREKILTPPIGLDHNPKTGDAAGWIDSFQRVGKVLYFKPKWTSLGLDKLKGDAPLRRHLSAEIRKNFRAGTDDDGAIIEGLCPVGAALLGRDLPELKGLVDLAGAVGFSATDDVIVLRDTIDADDSHAVYFAEITSRDNEEHFAMKTLEQLQKELDDEKALREKAEKERDEALAAQVAAKRDAELSEFRAKASTRVEKLVAEKTLGSEAAKKAQAFLVSLHSTDTNVAEMSEAKNESALEKAFSEFLDMLMPIDANFIEIDRKKDDGSAGVTVANFSEAATNTVVAQKIDRAVTERQKTNPKFTSADLLAELRSKSVS